MRRDEIQRLLKTDEATADDDRLDEIVGLLKRRIRELSDESNFASLRQIRAAERETLQNKLDAMLDESERRGIRTRRGNRGGGQGGRS